MVAIMIDQENELSLAIKLSYLFSCIYLQILYFLQLVVYPSRVRHHRL